MDRMIYTAMAGARQLMVRQDILANNLANASTNGFRADLEALRAVPLQGPDAGLGTRVSVVSVTPGADFSAGPIQGTGRDLDAAIDGTGFFAVTATDGSEAYTRNGSFAIGADGTLRTRSGLEVVGDGGPISVPEGASIEIGRDGTVSAIVSGSGKNSLALGRLKLVSPATTGLVKGSDGLFRNQDGSAADADPSVRVVGGSLEGSNVNVIETMVGMIALARQYEMTMKSLTNAEDNSRTSSKLLQPSS